MPRAGRARAAAAVGGRLAHCCAARGNPPVTRLAYWLSAQECTIDISRARAELGYEPVRSRSRRAWRSCGASDAAADRTER